MIKCSIFDDLIPLYIEGDCSDESKAAIVEHLENCDACRNKLKQLKRVDITPQKWEKNKEPQIADCVKKVKRRRIRMSLLVCFLSVLSACLLSICILTIRDMHLQANPVVYDVEDGVYNLTNAPLQTTAGEVADYVFFTNNKKIKVEVEADSHTSGQIILWVAEDNREPVPILYGSYGSDEKFCVFSGLTSVRRYLVTCEGSEGMIVTVSEDREVSFFRSLRNVLSELFLMLIE